MTVSSWGKGSPDYYIPTKPGISSVIDDGDTQLNWLLSQEYVISAQSKEETAFYTVPEGYNLSLGGGSISSNLSCINKLRIISETETILGDFSFDVIGNIQGNALNASKIATGEVMTVTIWNNNTSEGKFNLTLSGVLIKV